MMPLIVKDFTWRQNGDSIVLNVKIKGIKAARASIVTADDYIRVHFHPYIFEVFLWGLVDDVEGNCTIDEQNECVHLELPKLQKPCHWESLEKDLTRDEKRAKRERAVELMHTRTTEAQEKKNEKRREQKQMTVHEQLRIDDEERQRIAAIKNAESEKALAEMDCWRQAKKQQEMTRVSTSTSTPGCSKQNENSSYWKEKLSLEINNARIDSAQNDTHFHDSDEESRARECENGSNSDDQRDDRLTSTTTNKIKTQSDTAIWRISDDLTSRNFSAGKGGGGDGGLEALIPIRVPGHISVTFTAREFPTPSRESQAAEEAEWLKKQAEARRKCGFNDADLRPEERDPSWLLDKGLSLMKTGSFLGAVSAFSLGIKLAPKMQELYTERSNAHLALKNFCKAVEDSSQALELLNPKVAQNSGDRLKCHKRRGVGFSNLKMYEEALLDFQEALLLQPDDIELLRERDNAQRALDKHQINVSSSDED